MTVPVVTEPPAVRRSAWLPGYALLAAIWGSSFLFIKVGVRELHPMYVTLGRAGTGALTVLILAAVLRQRLPRSLAVWGHLVVVGALGVAIPFTLFGYGEQRIPSILAGIWNATTPLFVLPVAVLVMRTEKMTPRRAIGLVLGFVGVLVILGVWRGDGGSGLVGQLCCGGAALCYGIAIPYQRRFLSHHQGGVGLVAGQLIMATALLALVAPFVAGAPPVPWHLAPEVVASVFALGALGTGIAFAINFRIVRLVGASTSASVTYVVPIFATLIGVLVLGENLTWYEPVGAAIVLVGVAISQRRVAARRRVAPAVVSAPVPS